MHAGLIVRFICAAADLVIYEAGDLLILLPLVDNEQVIDLYLQNGRQDNQVVNSGHRRSVLPLIDGLRRGKAEDGLPIKLTEHIKIPPTFCSR